MPKNHDYAAPEIEKCLPKEEVARALVIENIRRLKPIPLTVPRGKAVVEIAKHPAFGPVVGLLGPLAKKAPQAFSTSYQLDAGVHLMNVRGDAALLFQLCLLVYPEGGHPDDADGADAAWLKKLDEIGSAASDMTLICSDLFLKNHVVTQQQIPEKMAAGKQLAAALRSVLRGKATTVIVLDAAARRRLFAEVIERTKANEYSSSGMYTSNDLYDTYNLDPQRQMFQHLLARFLYSVYHEKDDGLWRISHYERITDPKVVREAPARVLQTASDHGQTELQRDITKTWRDNRAKAQDRLDDIEKRRVASKKALTDAAEKIVNLGGRVAETQAQVDDWGAYAKKFAAEHELLTEQEILERIRVLEPKVKTAVELREAAKPAVTKAAKHLEMIESMPKPQSEAEEKERKQLRDEAIKILDLVKAKRTDAADEAKPLEDEIEQWKKRVGKGYAAYKQQNTPVPLDKLRETLKRQQEALDKAQADRKKADEELDLATYDEDWEGDDLRHAVAWNSEQLEDPPNRHHDWIRKLRELTNAANRKAQDAARQDMLAGTAERLPDDWAARVTPKNKDAKK